MGKGIEQICKEEQMANKYTKKCLTSLAIREIQIQTSLRVHLTPLRMAIIEKIKRPMLARTGGIVIHCRWECKVVQPLWKTVWGFLKKNKPKTELPRDIIYNSWAYFQRNLSQSTVEIPVHHVYSSTIHNSQIWNQYKCPSTNEWIKKMYYSAIKKNKTMSFAGKWME
jgi:hypothetical protein